MRDCSRRGGAVSSKSGAKWKSEKLSTTCFAGRLPTQKKGKGKEERSPYTPKGEKGRERNKPGFKFEPS